MAWYISLRTAIFNFMLFFLWMLLTLVKDMVVVYLYRGLIINAWPWLQLGKNGMLDDWEENLAVITVNRTKDDELVIIHLGDCLWKDRSEVFHPFYLLLPISYLLLLFRNSFCFCIETWTWCELPFCIFYVIYLPPSLQNFFS